MNYFEQYNPGECKGITPDIRLKEAVELALEFFEQKPLGQPYKEGQRRIIGELVKVYGPRKLVKEIDREALVKLVRVYQARNVEVYNQLIHIKRFFELMRQEGVININPVQYRRLPFTIRPYAVKPIISEEQYRRLLSASMSPDFTEGWPIVIMGAWETGLRGCDIATLQWDACEDGSYVDFVNEMIVTRPSKMRRRKQRLEIPIAGEYLEALCELQQSRGDSKFVTPWLAHKFNFGTRPSHFWDEFKKIAVRCGMDAYTFHCFRHSFVTRCLRAGVSPVVIGSLTGQSLKMIQHYSRVDNSDKISALDAIRKATHAEQVKRLGYQPPV
jgi:integrase